MGGMSRLSIYAATLEEERSGAEVYARRDPDTCAILFYGGMPTPAVFPDVEVARAFLVWVGDGWSILHDLERLRALWRDVRAWDKCPNHDHPEYPCRGRVPPDGTHCIDCAADEEWDDSRPTSTPQGASE